MFQVEQIKDCDIDNLSISIEDADNDGIIEKEIVVLFTPNMEDVMNHFHIHLDKEECERLCQFLITHKDALNEP